MQRQNTIIRHPASTYWPWPAEQNPIDPPGTGDVQVLPRDGLPKYLIAPHWAGTRHFGTNIVPRPTDTGNYQAVSPANQYDLMYDFCVQGTSGAAWVWIKRQIDRIHALGGTFVRYFWDVSAFSGDATHHGVATWRGTVTTPQLHAAQATICQYLASLNMWFYPTAMEAAQCDTTGALTALPALTITGNTLANPTVITSSTAHGLTTGQTVNITGSNSTPTINGTARPVIVISPTTFSVAVNVTVAGTTGSFTRDFGGLRQTSAGILAYIDAYIAGLLTQPNVLACDVLMEFARSDWAMEGTNLTAVMNRAKAARGNATLPLTCSVWAGSGTFSNYDALMVQATTAGVEYFDFHVYTLSPGALLSPYVNNRWNLPCMIGETGITQNGFYFASGAQQNTVHPYAIERRAQHYQDVIASYEARWDLQVLTNYGAETEWLTDDGQDWDFTQHPEMSGPFQTGTTQIQLHDVSKTFAIGADTTIGAWSANSSYMLGWALGDFSNRYSVSSSRWKRANASFGLGVIDFFDLPSRDQSLSVDFLASAATPSGGQIGWILSARHTAANVNNFYFCIVNSQPVVPASDGTIAIWKFSGGAFTAIAGSQVVSLPFDLTQQYRLTFSASGFFPTTLTGTLTNLTTSTVVATCTGTDSAANLQVLGFLGLPSYVGDVYYTNVTRVCNGTIGPSLLSPTIGLVTSTSVALTWTITGGDAPYRSIPEYVAVDSHNMPTGNWTAAPSTTGTSATITGLTPLTVNYSFRIRVIDSAAQGIAA